MTEETIKQACVALRKFGPLGKCDDVVGRLKCVACNSALKVGDVITLVALGPGSDPEERAAAREGRPYNATSVPVHWACATGEE